MGLGTRKLRITDYGLRIENPWLLGCFSSMLILLSGWLPMSEAEDVRLGAFKPFETLVDHPVKAELIAEHASIQPGGRTRIGILFTLEEGWHIYAQTPGDAGLPTKVVWSSLLPVLFGPLAWPQPQKFFDPGDIQTFGYVGVVLLASELTVPKDISGTISIHADVQWLACKNVCVPGSVSLDASLPVSNQSQTVSPYASFFTNFTSQDSSSGTSSKGSTTESVPENP